MERKMFRRFVKRLGAVAFIATLSIRIANLASASSPILESALHYDQGLIALYHQDYEQAILALKRVVEINPSHADAYYRLGTVYYGVGQWKE